MATVEPQQQPPRPTKRRPQDAGSESIESAEPESKRAKMSDDDGPTAKTTTNGAAGVKAGEVDEKLYSRQLYVMGREAQKRMMSSRALIIGMGGLGAEVAKNAILAGLNAVTLCDPSEVTSFDLGGNFYLSESDVGKKGRAGLVRDRLAELNRYVEVGVADVPSLSDADALCALVAGTSVVVVTVPLPDSVLFSLNEQCRKVNSCFVYSLSTGVFGQVFCDFGPSFVVSDKDGESPAQSQVETILPENPAVVKVLEDQGRHGLETGDHVTFGRVKGLDGALNDPAKSYEVKVTGLYTFELVGLDLSKCTEPATQGYITQVKQPVTVSHKTYQDSLEDPGEMMMSDFAKFDRPQLLHLGYRALAAHLDAKKALPSAGCPKGAQALVDMAQELDKGKILEGDEKEEKEGILRRLSFGALSQLSPMCAALGGVVAQEALKACSGKFTPISGFFFLDADESLPRSALPPSEVELTGERYDSQIAVFGKTAQEKLADLNYFLVGAGAIGCEMLKNWALMGLGCGPKGKIHITDMDRIEVSNLSRQFLFRDGDVGGFKSATAADAAKGMNPEMKVTAYQERVGPDTEALFGDDFYDTLDGVCTALDNVEARLYVDSRCVFYKLPLLESGTLGTKGNTQIVVPHLTENYGATRDPPEKSVPVCTLKNFPNQIAHTLQWAKDHFEGTFKLEAEDCNAYLESSSKEDYLDSLRDSEGQKSDRIKSVVRALGSGRPQTFEDCVAWARLEFERMFGDQIKQLLHNFPEDQVTSSGTKFWSGSKRCPKPLAFNPDHKCEDAEMRNHLDFVIAASNLRASVYGIEGSTDEERIQRALVDVIVPEFVPIDGVKIAASDAEAKENEEAGNSSGGRDEDDNPESLLSSLPSPSELSGGMSFRLNPVDFDKDLDDHMLFVASCSNLRALNYSIPTEDMHRSRAVAGRIIPAIATTTALVSGLICLELYKVAGMSGTELGLDAYKNAFANLAVPFVTMSEPTPPAKTKAMLKGKEWNWTEWDKIELNMGDITLREFVDHFEKEYNLEVTMLSYGVALLFSFFANPQKVKERMKMPMSEVVRSVSKKDLPPDQLFLILDLVAADLSTDEEVELPSVKFRFR